MSALNDAKNLLKVEADAILAAAERMGPEFDSAIELIKSTATRGKKLVLMGMGKSHYIAAKIAASFMSTGVTAIFIHPAEAIHGDLGIIHDDDCCVLISKSGGTAELVALVPYLKGRTKIIAIVGNKKSPIADAAHCVLDASVEKEACPINMLPTASTTLALALGDALVSCFARVDGFNPEKFSGFHPGGSIGKRLNREVFEIMLPVDRVPIGRGGESLQKAAELMSARPVGALCIIGEKGELQGIVVDGDLRRALAKGVDPKSNVDSVIIREPATVAPDMLVNDALAVLEQQGRQITSAPVVDRNGKLVGFVRIHDLL